MKKNLILAGIIVLGLTSSVMAEEAAPQKKPECKCKPECRCNKPFKKHDFTVRLNLTEEQKELAKTIRQNGHEKMKPVFDDIAAKFSEIREIEDSKLPEGKKEKKIEALKKDIKKLNEKAKEIKDKNTKEFEAILTPEQKKEFEIIKEEGKKRFEQNRKPDCAGRFKQPPIAPKP